jgi:hypothetical protein
VARGTVAATCTLIALALGCTVSASQPPEVTPRRALATRTAAVIRVDGRLDEAAWQEAQPIGALVQREPLEGAEPSETTDVRILYDDRALYVGILCRDRSPREIVSTQLARDADLDVDDRITIVLDTFLDHRNGFFFQVNPSGARADGQVSNNAETLSRDWDGIWNAVARITDEGWVVEIEIPFKTLRFRPGQAVWGLNVERQITRRLELDRWTAARQNVWISNLAEAGRLDGLDGLVQGQGLDVRPYVSGFADGDSREMTGGGDLFKNITPNLNAAITVNTDFAETEVDLQQVNLTRFPLFFPEKRAFFLEGAGIFDIAGLAHTTDLVPFFSRRVGLLDSLAVPIRVGAKLTGRQSDYNVGVLDAETGGLSDPGLPSGSVDRQNLFAARVSRNVLNQSWIGGILTHGDPTGAGANTLVGTDARLATSTFRGSKNLALELFVMATDDRGTRDGAGGIRLDYPNDRWDLALNWRQIGKHFQPALGFVPRPGIRTTDVSLAFQPRPDEWGIRQVFFQVNPIAVTNLQNRLESASLATTPFNVQTESGDHLEWDCTPTFERLDTPFAIATSVLIPPGAYQWTRFRAAGNTATKRLWVVDASWSWGGFYGGRLRQLDVAVTLKPDTHVALSAQAQRNDVALPQGRFPTQILTWRADYNFTPNMSWANLAQYDNESRVAGLQSRFRWILQPGNDLFLVLNRGWQRSLTDDRFEPLFDRGSGKLQYTFRF